MTGLRIPTAAALPAAGCASTPGVSTGEAVSLQQCVSQSRISGLGALEQIGIEHGIRKAPKRPTAGAG